MYYVRCVCINVVPCGSIQVWGLSSIQQITSFNLSSLLGFHTGDCRWARGIGHHHIIASEALASFTFYFLCLCLHPNLSLSLSHSIILGHFASVYVWDCLFISHTKLIKIQIHASSSTKRRPTLAKCTEFERMLMVLVLSFIQQISNI